MIAIRNFLTTMDDGNFLLDDFIFEFTWTSIGLLVTGIHQLIALIQLLTSSIDFLIHLQIQNSAVEISG